MGAGVLARSPGRLLWDLDGLDLTATFPEEGGTIYQVSVSAPSEIPQSPSAVRAVDMYWGYELVPLDGGARSRLTLICQTRLNNIIPTWLANRFVGDALSDYVRTAEQTGLAYTAAGKADALRRKRGLL